MPNNTKQLKTIIDDVLRPLGFTNKRSAWYRHRQDTILIVDLQKSDFGGQYYVNLSVVLRGLNADDYPREEFGHVRKRLDRIIEQREYANVAFDLEDTSITSSERQLRISQLIARGAEWLEGLSMVEVLTRELRSNESLQRHTTLQARGFLGLE